MKRTLEEVEADMTAALAVKKEADIKYWNALRVLEEHPAKKQKREDEAKERLRKKLPSYLFKALVTDAPNPVKALFVFSEYAHDDTSGKFEIEIHFADGQSRRTKIPFLNEQLVKEAAEDMFVPVDFDPDIEAAWELARKANNNDPARALTALIYAAAMYLEDIAPEDDFLVSLYK
jgi:hypothetical protein